MSGVQMEYLKAIGRVSNCLCGQPAILHRTLGFWRVTCSKCRKRKFGNGPMDAVLKWNYRIFEIKYPTPKVPFFEPIARYGTV